MNKLKHFGYWIAQLTWGGLMTWIGAAIALGLLISGFKPKRHGPSIYFEVGKGWGGFEMGAFFFCNKDCSQGTKNHEYGHSLQNIIFGPLMPFIVSIPSATRYWYRRYLNRVKKVSFNSMPDYDSVWFERWATNCGERTIGKW